MGVGPGTNLGPYQILAPLGAGGMGEVYRARDTRLGRDVAIKTLPAAFAQDPERRARFETEAKAIAALSHPNVLGIHDIGTDGAIVFAVMELVEGQTLREMLLGGPLSTQRTVSLAIQISNGLAAAHDRGIIHRDLKPENIIITPDGHAKILDFGLAKRVTPAEEGRLSLGPTHVPGTEPGLVLGTVGYMAPEQVRGLAADARSDIFALGALMYEMVSGRRAFQGDSPAETLTAILREEPRELTQLLVSVPPALERFIRRCLEKNPAGRFRSAADLAFALEGVSTSSGATRAVGTSVGAVPPGLAKFRRITFRNGVVLGARFTPDGSGVAFSAMWEGRPAELFISHPGSPAARSLGVAKANLLAISPSGEMALALDCRNHYWLQRSGTLARVALAGGGIRQLQKDVGDADWGPDGRAMALIRYAEGRCRLEYPAGKLLFETTEWLSCVRVSHDGRHVAFAYHPAFGDSGGDVRLVEPSGATRMLTPRMTSVSGVAWSPAGDEVWFSGINEMERHGIWGERLAGGHRAIFSSPLRVNLYDVARDGRVLMSNGSLRVGLNVSSDGGDREVDLSWFDGSVVADFSADGREVLLFEADEAENPHYACYLRDVDGAPAVRLGEGTATRLSADGQWVLAILHQPEQHLAMYPTGIGEPRLIPFDGIERLIWAGFHPDGRHVFVVGSSAGHPNRLFLLPIHGGTPRLLWDEEVGIDRIAGMAISPDGERLAFRRVSGEHVMFTLSTGATETIRELGPGDYAMRFDDSGRWLYVASGTGLQQRVDRLELKSGERSPWRALQPPDPTGIVFVGRPVVTTSGSRYAYSYIKQMSDLYVVDGLG